MTDLSKVRKVGTMVNVSREMLIDAGVLERTPEEQAEHDRMMADYNALVDQRRAEVDAFMSRLRWAAIDQGGEALMIFGEHPVIDYECQNEDCTETDQGGDMRRDDAPCLAHRVLARMLGVELP